VSPDLTTNDASKIGYPSTPFCTISTLSESPITADVIWVGTDDGKVQVTRDAGRHWADATAALAAGGAPADRWVSRVFASPHDAATAFVAKNGFRNDDFAAYLYETTDAGRSWKSIAGDLPAAPVNVVVQDRRNPHLLFVGNDIGVFVSIDDGDHWSRLKANLPTVAVHDLLVHPREQDLVLATYGRALWTGDIAPLQELTPETLREDVHLFDVKPKARYGFGRQGMNYELYGDKYIEVPNEPEAFVVNYFLLTPQRAAQVTVEDAAGVVVRTIDAPGDRGLNRVLVPFAADRGRGAAGRGGPPAPPPLGAGTYRINLNVAGRTLSKTTRVLEWP